jgi:hypothetical protein
MSAYFHEIDWRLRRIREFLYSDQTADVAEMAADLFLDEDELRDLLECEAHYLGVDLMAARVLH